MKLVISGFEDGVSFLCQVTRPLARIFPRPHQSGMTRSADLQSAFAVCPRQADSKSALRSARRSAVSPPRAILRRFFNARDTEISAAERRGGCPLRPLREPLPPLRLLTRSGCLVAALPRCERCRLNRARAFRRRRREPRCQMFQRVPTPTMIRRGLTGDAPCAAVDAFPGLTL